MKQKDNSWVFPVVVGAVLIAVISVVALATRGNEKNLKSDDSLYAYTTTENDNIVTVIQDEKENESFKISVQLEADDEIRAIGNLIRLNSYELAELTVTLPMDKVNTFEFVSKNEEILNCNRIKAYNLGDTSNSELVYELGAIQEGATVIYNELSNHYIVVIVTSDKKEVVPKKIWDSLIEMCKEEKNNHLTDAVRKAFMSMSDKEISEMTKEHKAFFGTIEEVTTITTSTTVTTAPSQSKDTVVTTTVPIKTEKPVVTTTKPQSENEKKTTTVTGTMSTSKTTQKTTTKVTTTTSSYTTITETSITTGKQNDDVSKLSETQLAFWHYICEQETQADLDVMYAEHSRYAQEYAASVGKSIVVDSTLENGSFSQLSTAHAYSKLVNGTPLKGSEKYMENCQAKIRAVIDSCPSGISINFVFLGGNNTGRMKIIYY